MTHAVNLLLQKIKLCSLTNLISQAFSDTAVILGSSVQALHSRVASCEYARLEYRIFVYLPFGHSRKRFSNNTFSVEQLTLGYHFKLTSSLPRHFQASEKLWNKTLCPLRLVSFVDWKISKHVRDLIFLHNNFIRNVFFVC